MGQAYSLYTSTKILTFHHKIRITDEQGNTVYTAKSKFFTLHDNTNVYDASGKKVAHIRKKFFTLHERHFVTMDDGQKFQLSNELLHIIKDVTNIEGLGWQLRGNILELHFELYSPNEGTIAVIGQKLISIHDKYSIDIYKREYEKQVVAILVTLQHMVKDRTTASVVVSS